MNGLKSARNSLLRCHTFTNIKYINDSFLLNLANFRTRNSNMHFRLHHLIHRLIHHLMHHSIYPLIHHSFHQMSPVDQNSKDAAPVTSSFPSPANNPSNGPQLSICNPSINPPRSSSPPSSEKIKEPHASYPSGPQSPQFVVRPILSNPPPKFLLIEMGNSLINHPLTMEHWLRVFGWLGPRDLSNCMLVCRTWNTWCYYSPLWRSMDVSRRRIRKVMMMLC